MENNQITPQQVEVRCLAADLRIESREQADSRTITGYAAKFESWSEPILGWFKEKIARSAFEGCDLSDVIMCFNHNVDNILARTTSGTLTLSTDDVGLRFSFDAPNTTRGNDMLELVRRGDINKCSFKFIVETDEWRYADDKNKLEYDERTIIKFAAIKDVALVVFPAYKDTEASVRHLEERKQQFMEQFDISKPNSENESSTTEDKKSLAENQARDRLLQILNIKN